MQRGHWIAIATLAVVLAAAAAWSFRPQSEALRVQVVALQPQGGANAERLAGTLQEDIVGVLSQSGVQTTDSGRSGLLPSSSRQGVMLKGSVVETAGRLQVRIFLDDVQSGLTLWSGRFERPTAYSDLLTDQATVAATEAILAMLETTQQPGFRLNPRLTALYIRGIELTNKPQFLSEGVPRKNFEQIVREAPDFGAGHAMLAFFLAGEANRAAPSDRAALVERAQDEIAAAIRIDPHTAGAAYGARFTLSASTGRPIANAEDVLLDGLRHVPDYPYLSHYECGILREVGRVGDALPYCQRSMALRPLAGPIGHNNARTLSVAGQRELAKNAIERAARYNPDQEMTRLTRLEIATFYGAPDEAAELLRDPATTPLAINGHTIEALESFLLARRTGAPADVEAAVDAAGAVARDDPSYLGFAIKTLAVLGRTDEAFALLESMNLESSPRFFSRSFLFEPVTASLRSDRRFWPVAARLGLVQYWLARNKWPDFCGEEVSLATCKAAAASADLSRS